MDILPLRIRIPSSSTLQSLSLSSPKKIMYFIHGWPDNYTVWENQLHYFTEVKGYICIAVTLPFFEKGLTKFDNGIPLTNGEKKWQWKPQGYSFKEISDMLAISIKACIDKYGQLCSNNSQEKKVTLVIFDWGVYFGTYMSERYSSLVNEIIQFDVGRPQYGAARVKDIPKMMFLGFAYQYFLITIWILSWIPLVGHRFANYLLCQKTSVLPVYKYKSLTPMQMDARQCYPYIMIHKQFVLELFGFVKPILEVSQQQKKKKDDYSYFTHPICFIYGNKKAFNFHTNRFERKLQQDDRCEIHALASEHWIMREQSDQVNEIMFHFMNKNQNQNEQKKNNNKMNYNSSIQQQENSTTTIRSSKY